MLLYKNKTNQILESKQDTNKRVNQLPKMFSQKKNFQKCLSHRILVFFNLKILK